VTADEALLRLFQLSNIPHTHEVRAEYEPLVPILIEAGYVDGYTLAYTKEGLERIDALDLEAVRDSYTYEDFARSRLAARLKEWKKSESER
jgi:hypothetical protein